jgi:hypothetical protein
MRYLIQQNIVLFIVSLIIYYYNPSFGLILLSLSIGLFVWETTRKKTKIAPVIAILSTISLFFLLEDFSTKRQARIIVAEVYDYYRHNHKTPSDLKEIFVSATMSKTSLFSGFNYGTHLLSAHRCEWKLEFTNVWGTHYFYDDKVGEFEKTQKWNGTAHHWNQFWKIEPHLKITDERKLLD